ncbi:unnamed protein product [Rotaria sp. Silwood2]|nr:unnamed protein product [Rotaria sp. Silwood2]CAF4483578.1 unnamed protein product [Rotaria sp. Silwood2]
MDQSYLDSKRWEQLIVSYMPNLRVRKYYTFYWESDIHICSHLQENDLNSVKHVHIHNERMTDNFVNYFPNTTQLTLQYRSEKFDNSIITSFDRIVPLEQLTKLVIEVYNFPFEEFIIKLLCLTPNLQTLKLK